MNLQSSLAGLLEKYQVDAAILVKVPGKKPLFSNNINKVFRSASLIKLAIAYYICKNFPPEILRQALTIDKLCVVKGSGVIFHLRQRTWYIADLLDLMLSVSDNTATNVLLDHFGITQINQQLQQLYPPISLKRYMLSSVAAGENTLSLKRIMQLWQNLFLQDQAFLDVIQPALHYQQNTGKLRAYANSIGFKGRIWNKTGELSNEEHDLARFSLNDRVIDCGVLTHFTSQNQRGRAIILQQKIGKIIMNFLMAELSN